jgi:hypothetical protein
MAVRVARADDRQHERSDDSEVEDGPLAEQRYVSFRLEAEVLQRLGCPPVVTGRLSFCASLRCEIALRDPGCCPVADRRRLLKAPIGREEHFSCLDQAILLEQGTAQ